MRIRAALLVVALAVPLVAVSSPSDAHAQQGDTWDVVLDLPSGSLQAGTFASNDVAWAAGLGATFRSTNGGRTWQTAHVSSRFLSGIDAAPDGQRGWATGILGELLYTEDGGVTWTKRAAGTSINLRLVEAFDADSLVVGGEGEGVSDAIVLPQPYTFRRSDDGGATWHELDLGGYAPLAMSWTDDDHGWVAGSRCVSDPVTGFGCNAQVHGLFRTDDGGESWEQIDDGVMYRQLEFVSATDGWAVRADCPDRFDFECPSTVAITDDRGATWSDVRDSSRIYGFGPLAAVDERTAMVSETVCAPEGANCVTDILGTRDGGATWQGSDPNTDPLNYTADLAVAPDSRAVQFQSAGARYSDDLVTWADATFPTTVGTGAFDFIDAQTGWFAASKLLRTQDAGATWEPVSDLAPVEVDFVSANEGWASTFAYDFATGAQTVTIQRTDDGGATWREQYRRTFGNYLYLTAIDAQNAWAYSLYDGLLLHTRDGGASWYEQPIPVDADGNSPGIVFVDARVGWLAEPICEPAFANCTHEVWRTADGGDTWQLAGHAPNPEGCPSLIEAVDDRHAWVGGFGCALQRTTNGGVTWMGVAPPPGGGVTAAPTFFDRNIGRTTQTMCDQTGTACTDSLLRTSDGGTTWSATPTGVEGFGNETQFVSPERGWRLVQDGGGLFAVSRHRLYRFVGAGPDELPPPLPPVVPPDTGSGQRRNGEALSVLTLIAVVGAAVALFGIGIARRSR